MKKMLLHICCAACGASPVREFGAQYDITGFFYNPNIDDLEEYQKRESEARRIFTGINLPYIEGPYDVDDWLKSVRGFEKEPEGGRRCDICFTCRLQKTAEAAIENGCDCFTTVLTISPYHYCPVKIHHRDS